MLDMAVETTEPDPSATSIENDQTVNNLQDEAMPEDIKETLGMSLIFNAYSYYRRPQSTTICPNN